MRGGDGEGKPWWEQEWKERKRKEPRGEGRVGEWMRQREGDPALPALLLSLILREKGLEEHPPRSAQVISVLQGTKPAQPCSLTHPFPLCSLPTPGKPHPWVSPPQHSPWAAGTQLSGLWLLLLGSPQGAIIPIFSWLIRKGRNVAFFFFFL